MAKILTHLNIMKKLTLKDLKEMKKGTLLMDTSGIYISEFISYEYINTKHAKGDFINFRLLSEKNKKLKDTPDNHFILVAPLFLKNWKEYIEESEIIK